MHSAAADGKLLEMREKLFFKKNYGQKERHCEASIFALYPYTIVHIPITMGWRLYSSRDSLYPWVVESFSFHTCDRTAAVYSPYTLSWEQCPVIGCISKISLPRVTYVIIDFGLITTLQLPRRVCVIPLEVKVLNG